MTGKPEGQTEIFYPKYIKYILGQVSISVFLQVLLMIHSDIILSILSIYGFKKKVHLCFYQENISPHLHVHGL